MTLLKRLKQWWLAQRGTICPKCYSPMLDTYSGDFGGVRCTKCPYRLRHDLIL